MFDLILKNYSAYNMGPMSYAVTILAKIVPLLAKIFRKPDKSSPILRKIVAMMAKIFGKLDKSSPMLRDIVPVMAKIFGKLDKSSLT